MATTATTSVLLVGATSPIGHALSRLLLQRGHRLRVLTRAPSAPALRALQGLGAALLETPDDDAELSRLCQEADALVLAPALGFDPAPELERLGGLIDLAGAAAAGGGPAHLVLVSAASADESTGVPYLDACFRLERRAAGSGLPFSVVRPVLLMESLLSAPFLRPFGGGVLELPLPPWRRVMWAAALDVAEATARVVEEPERFVWRVLEVAGDVRSPAKAALALSAALGRELEPRAPAPERLLELDPELVALFAWLDDAGHHVDIDAVRATFPALPVGSLEAWARSLDLELLDLARAPSGAPSRR